MKNSLHRNAIMMNLELCKIEEVGGGGKISSQNNTGKNSIFQERRSPDDTIKNDSTQKNKEKIVNGIEQEIKKNVMLMKNKNIFQRVTPLLSEIAKRKKSEVASFALVNIVRQEFQKKINEKHEKKLSQNVVNLTDPEDCEMIARILQKHKPSKREIAFVINGLLTQPIFDQNQSILQDITQNQTAFKEFKFESFNPLQAIFNKGDLGKKYYILLKGEVFCLITDQQAEEAQQTPAASPQNLETFSTAIGSKKLNGQTKIEVPPPLPTIHQINQRDSMGYNEYIYFKNKYPLQKIIKIYQPGESFGEIALITRGQRMGSMICRTDVEVISLTREGFNRIKGAWIENELNKKLIFLRRYSFFQGLSDSRLMSILHLIEINKYEKNNILYSKNDKSKFLYFVYDGTVKLFTYVVDDYPLIFKKLSKQTINQDIQKYLKNIKDKQKIIPLISLEHGSYFGEWEILNSAEKRQTKAIIESETAELFQIDINKFIDAMKGFNGGYDYLKDFQSKDTFQKQRIEKILNVNSQIKENILNTKKQKQFDNLKQQLEETNAVEEKKKENEQSFDEIQQDDLSSLEISKNNYNYNDEQRNQSYSPTNSRSNENQDKYSLQFPQITPTANGCGHKKSNSATDDSHFIFSQSSFHGNSTKNQSNNNNNSKGQLFQTELNEDNYNINNDCIKEQEQNDQLIQNIINNGSLFPSIKKNKIQSQHLSDSTPTIRSKVNSEIIYIDEFFRKKNKAIQESNHKQQSQQLFQSNFQSVCKNLESNKFNNNKYFSNNAYIQNQNDDDKQINQKFTMFDRSNYSSRFNQTERSNNNQNQMENNKDKSNSSFHSFIQKNQDNVNENQFIDFSSLHSRKNSSGEEYFYKTQQNQNQTQIQQQQQQQQFEQQSTKLEKEYFHSFLKQKIEQLQIQKQQNLKILNYKNFNLKFIGTSPEEVIEKCRKQSKFQLDRGEMSGSMKKSVMEFTNQGLFSSPYDTSRTHKPSLFTQETQKLHKKSSDLSIKIKHHELKSSDFKSEFQNQKIQQFLSKNNSGQSNNNNDTYNQFYDSQQINKNNFQIKINDTSSVMMESHKEDKLSQQETQNSPSCSSRYSKQQQNFENRYLEQLQKYKNQFQIDLINDMSDVKIKQPKFFQPKEKTHRSNYSVQQQPDLFQIQKFSLKQNHKSDFDYQIKSNNIDQNYFQKILPSEQYNLLLDLESKSNKDTQLNGFIPTAKVRPYITKSIGSPKNQYNEIQDYYKEQDHNRNELGNNNNNTRRHSLIQIKLGNDQQYLLNNMPKNKEQQDIVSNLMLSPRLQLSQRKQFEQLKNKHIYRQKLNNHKRNKSLV